MNEYELLYIVTPRKAPADVDTVIDWVGQQVGSAGGEVLKTNNWGRRRLAYPINHHFEGTYVLQHLRMPATAAVSLESVLHITEDVIRHMLTRGIVNPEGSAPPEYVGERPRFAPRPVPAAPMAEAPAEAPPVAAEEVAVAEAPVAEAAEAPAAEQKETAEAAPVESAAAAVEADAEEPTPAATE